MLPQRQLNNINSLNFSLAFFAEALYKPLELQIFSVIAARQFTSRYSLLGEGVNSEVAFSKNPNSSVTLWFKGDSDETLYSELTLSQNSRESFLQLPCIDFVDPEKEVINPGLHFFGLHVSTSFALAVGYILDVKEKLFL